MADRDPTQQPDPGVGGQLAGYLLSRALPHLFPWLLTWGLLPIAGAATHTAWGADPWATAGLALMAFPLTLLTLAVSHTRHLIGRVHSAASTFGALAWLTAATITGPLARPTLDILALGGGGMALAWSIRRVIRAATDNGEVGGVGWGEALNSAGLGGAKLLQLTARPHGERATLQLERGKQTGADVARARGQLESALAAPPGGVRVQPNPDRADRATVTVTRTDLLKQVIPWPGPAHTGRSIFDAPIHLGRYEDGEAVLLDPFAGPERDLTHLLIGGMSGSGKSYGIRIIVAHLFHCADVRVWGAEIAKGDQTFGDLAGGLDWFVKTRPDGLAMLEALKRIIPVRATHLARLGLDKWQPGSGMPLLAVVIDEASALVANSKTFEEVAQQSRSAGIWLIVAVQRPNYAAMPINAREQFGGGLCFGLKDGGDADWILGDLAGLGADPGVWKNQRKGYCYLTLPGIDPDRQLTPLRTCLGSREQFTDATAAADDADPMDAATVEAAGAAYAGRAIITPPQPEDGGEEAGLMDTDDTDADADAELAALLASDPHPDLPVDLDADIPDRGEGIDLPRPRRLPTDQARAAFRTALDGLAAAGRQTFTRRDVLDVPVQVGRSLGWLHEQLNRAVEEGLIVRDPDEDGTYRIRALAGAGAR